MTAINHNLKFQTVKVRSQIEIAANVYVLDLDISMKFIAGQVVAIALPGKKEAHRLYSILNGEKDRYIKVLYNIKPGGALTPKLAKLRKGDAVLVSDPFGSFNCREEVAVWIATGTGIAPFYSMMRSGLSNGKTFIHGARSKEGLYFTDEFRSGMSDRYNACVTSEGGGNIFEGRVTDYIKSLNSLQKDIKYYLCGNPLMVVEVRDILLSRGAPYSNIESEIYF